MELLSLEQVADLLALAHIAQSFDFGHAIVHNGSTAAGLGFVLVNDCFGRSVITYSL